MANTISFVDGTSAVKLRAIPRDRNRRVRFVNYGTTNAKDDERSLFRLGRDVGSNLNIESRVNKSRTVFEPVKIAM